MAAVRQRPTPRVLGLTGPIACGKTTVGDVLLELGALERIDADAVVHALLSGDEAVITQVVASFGTEIMSPGGGIDRKRLGAVVFSERDALKRLESIVHPAVRNEIRSRLASLQGRSGVVVVDAVKLLQSDILPLCHSVWVVTCSPTAQMERLLVARGMTEGEARNRLASQPSFDHPRVSARIENSGSLDELRQRVVHEWDRLIAA